MSSSRSSFFGFEIAKTGLFVSQHNLNVTGHNISNVNTPGYTRQRLVTSAIEPYSSIGQIRSMEHGILGGGTKAHYVEQLRSQYLDEQYRSQNSTVSTWATRTQGLEFLERVFDEPNNVGIMSMLQRDFYNAISDLQTTPTGQAQREVLQQNAIKLTETLNQFYRQMVEMQSNQNQEVASDVMQVNSIADQIGELNKLIYAFERNGEHANDLRDQRNLLLDKLSSLVEIEVREYRIAEGQPTTISVSIGSGASKGYLVDYKQVNHLDVAQIANPISEDTSAGNVTGHPDATLNLVIWKAGYTHGADAPPTNPATLGEIQDLVGNGAIKGLLTLRDGNSNTEMGTPYFVHELDKLAQALVKEFNAVHSKGYTMPRDSNGNISETNINFFEDFGDVTKVTAGNFKLSADVLKDVWKIACSDKPVISPNDPRLDPNDPAYDSTLSANEGNNTVTLKDMLGLLDAKNLPGVSSFGDFYRKFLVDVGTTTDYSRTRAESNDVLCSEIDVRRMSISAVSIDEEMTNMIKFQHSYSAASRVITTIDEMLDKLINGTGVVGR